MHVFTVLGCEQADEEVPPCHAADSSPQLLCFTHMLTFWSPCQAEVSLQVPSFLLEHEEGSISKALLLKPFLAQFNTPSITGNQHLPSLWLRWTR